MLGLADNDFFLFFQRLVNLISVAVSLSENCNSDNLINYPNIKRLTEAFASEMVKSIECKVYLHNSFVNESIELKHFFFSP